MNTTSAFSASAYNATLVEIERIHPDLAIFRILPDFGQLRFTAGQYTVLGLGTWEPRLPETQPEPPQPRRLIQRAYSISCGLVDGHDRLMRAAALPLLEFYITLIRSAREPPALTPRLFALTAGSRLYCGHHARGQYGLAAVKPDENVVFAATGTGEAPHNAMLSELLASGHRARIVSVTCARYLRDLAYRKKHRTLELRFSNYQYVPLTTREPENIDRSVSNFVGKRYLQDYFESGDFERETGCPLEPDRTHVFLCGSPAMIGAPGRRHNADQLQPPSRGMVEILERRGFQVDLAHHPGHLHFERYW